MHRLPPLNALKAFEAAGRHLNFRLAADEIGVTHGAVAQHVRALEARVGVKLFKRLPRGLALTDEGRKYLAPVRRAFEMIAGATDELCPQQAELTISVTPSFASKWLVPRLGRFTYMGVGLDRIFPCFLYQHQAPLLAALESVDFVTSFSEDTPLSLIKRLKPHFLAKGADYTLGQIVGAKEVKEWGGRVARIPLVKGRSTTRIVNKMSR